VGRVKAQNACCKTAAIFLGSSTSRMPPAVTSPGPETSTGLASSPRCALRA